MSFKLQRSRCAESTLLVSVVVCKFPALSMFANLGTRVKFLKKQKGSPSTLE